MDRSVIWKKVNALLTNYKTEFKRELSARIIA
jgi:hypothetical protein